MGEGSETDSNSKIEDMRGNERVAVKVAEFLIRISTDVHV